MAAWIRSPDQMRLKFWQSPWVQPVGPVVGPHPDGGGRSRRSARGDRGGPGRRRDRTSPGRRSRWPVQESFGLGKRGPGVGDIDGNGCGAGRPSAAPRGPHGCGRSRRPCARPERATSPRPAACRRPTRTGSRRCRPSRGRVRRRRWQGAARSGRRCGDAVEEAEVAADRGRVAIREVLEGEAAAVGFEEPVPVHPAVGKRADLAESAQPVGGGQRFEIGGRGITRRLRVQCHHGRLAGGGMPRNGVAGDGGRRGG